ncbi:MAG: hypothetical protein Q9M94_03015 [Candidatus Gracilibacteria bacterium]|nr:hypothetical protein [Candidatus Gracilibacteria bacterium]MDQ7023576.1 hypothetical protein [Candidatus Gracilibacteria bacterium]
MTIITNQEELEKHLKEAREDIAYGRAYYSWEEMMESIELKVQNKEKELCIK